MFIVTGRFREVGHHRHCDPLWVEVKHHHWDPRCAGVDRELAARRAVCRASRLPGSGCTCTDAGTDAEPPCLSGRCHGDP